MSHLAEFPIGEAWEQRETHPRVVPPVDLVVASPQDNTFRTGSGNGVAERPARGSVAVAGHRGAADADEASSTTSRLPHTDRLQLPHQIGDLRDGLLQRSEAGVRPQEPDVVGVGLRIRNALWAALYGVRGGLRARPERQR